MIIWGLAWPCSKVLTIYQTPINVAWLRYFVVVALLSVFFPFFKISLQLNPKSMLYLLGAGIAMASYSYLYFAGLEIGLSGAGGVLVTTMNPIFAHLIGVVISQKFPKLFEKIGLLVGLVAGCFLLSIWNKWEIVFAGGNLYFLLAAFLWAIMSKLTSYGHQYGHALTFTYWMHFLTLIILSFFVDYGKMYQDLHTTDFLFWGNFAFFSIVNSAFATVCYLYATNILGPEKASGFLFIVPSSAALASYIFLGEIILSHTIIGGILGILAVLIINNKIHFLKSLIQNNAKN